MEYLEVELRGTERHSMAGRGAFETQQHFHALRRAPGATLTRGAHHYSSEFDLPAALPPSFAGGNGAIEYELTVRAAIPWWPDRREHFEVLIFPLTNARRVITPVIL